MEVWPIAEERKRKQLSKWVEVDQESGKQISFKEREIWIKPEKNDIERSWWMYAVATAASMMYFYKFSWSDLLCVNMERKFEAGISSVILINT